MIDVKFGCLAGKRAVVSGGASGIGAAIVAALAGQGVRVAFVDIDADAAEAFLRGLDDRLVSFHRCDVSDADEVNATAEGVGGALGHVDILVNNAASDERHRFGAVTPERWDRLIAVNLKHQFFLSQALLPYLRAGGSIINLSSISWRRGATDVPVYAVAKAGVEGLTRTLARDLGPRGVRVNALLPGMVLTERQKRLWLDEATLQDGLRNQCLKEHVQPDDIAQAALWLASSGSRMVTGQAIVVDGGWI